ncbi:AAA family ATPase [Bdellovibrionota bacterium FG-2]
MERDLYQKLVEWKRSPRRKPLILQGARQVGKTHLLETFGRKEYGDVAYFNFEENPALDDCFKGALDPEAIVQRLAAYRGQKILPKETLIFFDEIQESGRALTSLKYFNEKANHYHLVAAGSLLGIKLSSEKTFPVGKVNCLHLHPLSFFEFLNAMQKANLWKVLEGLGGLEPLPEPFHQELIEWLRIYYFLGGMPEVVCHYAAQKDFNAARTIQREILNAYSLDFVKHAQPSEALKISQIWESVPGQLAKENKKFIFSAIAQSARAREYEAAIQWLKDAGLIHLSYNVAVPKLPLEGHCDKKVFKVFLLDVGLLGAMVGLTSKTIVEGSKIFTEYKGAFVENYVAQELACAHEQPLYYWTSQGTAELDFLVAFEEQIFPLEAKAGVSKKKKSLIEYGNKYSPKHASEVLSRTSLMNFKKDGSICNYPLYAVRLFPKPGCGRA